MNHKTVFFWLIFILLTMINLAVYIFVTNKRKLTLGKYVIKSDKVTEPLSFVLLADLHGTFFGKNQEELLSKIEEAKPDAIFLCGDIFDEKTTTEAAELLLRGIGRKYPCYYVTGNHEYRADVDKFLRIVKDAGVRYLNDEAEILEIGSQKVCIAGMNDEKSEKKIETKDLEQKFQKMFSMARKDLFSVFLYHHPHGHLFGSCGYDLVVSGHVHGGQVRIPCILNGAFSPDEGFFPKYTAGDYVLGKTHLIVSKGLLVNWRPRINNPPEVVSIIVEPEEKQNHQ